MEEWKDITGYEGLYQVSNLGRVRRSGKILKGGYNNKGYHTINLCKNGISKSFFVHRLVAIAFIPNPNNFPIVNHKDENPKNNCVDNLEWCTKSYNATYGTAKERKAQTMFNNKTNRYSHSLSALERARRMFK